MDIRIRAAIETAKVLGTCAIIGAIVSWAFHFMTLEVFGWLLIVGMIGGAIYLCYTNCLMQLRSQELVDRLVDKR